MFRRLLIQFFLRVAGFCLDVTGFSKPATPGEKLFLLKSGQAIRGIPISMVVDVGVRIVEIPVFNIERIFPGTVVLQERSDDPTELE